MPISIYPPTLQSTQPAFLYTTNSYPVYFTLQQITSLDEVGHIQIRIVRQANNKSIVNTSLYPDGIIYKSTSAISYENSQYSIAILASDLGETWQPGYLYKIQLRFGLNAKFSSVSNFATWKKTQIDNSAFSEWSTVMIVKSIAQPTIYIKNKESIKQDVISTEQTEATLTPLFIGSFSISEASKESVDKYKFDLFDEDGKQLETSDWLQHNTNNDGGSNLSYDQYRFKTVLTNNESYSVVYSIQTTNGYETSSETYSFSAVQSYLSELDGVSLIVEDDTPYCRENGCMNLYLITADSLSGNYIISRSSESSDYSVWDDLVYLLYNNESFDTELIFQDFTIESGVRYKYAIQSENSAGLRTSPLLQNESIPKCVNFEYSFLYHNGVQLRLQFNQKLSSFKHTTLTTKQDTLGDKYPHLTRNGYAYYAEFPISGLISLHMDDNQTFFTLDKNGYWYDGENIISADKFLEDGESIFDTNVTYDNVFIERKFREKVEEFLNNLDYKLYKSPTEGNMIITLYNVSLTPQESVGRMIYNFSATAYEVLENTLENLNEFGLIDIGEFGTLESGEIIESFGQIRGLYTAGQDLYSLIKEQEEVSMGGGYKLNLQKVTSIRIEAYPQIDFTAELLELNAKVIDANDNGEDTSEYIKQIAEYEALEEALEGPLATTTILNINNKSVIVPPNKIYNVEHDITSLNFVSGACPIIINYSCDLNQVQDTSIQVVSAIEASRIWGQISGVFTGSDDILSTYNYDYKSSNTYRIYSNSSTVGIVYDAQGNVLVDNTNFNLYQTVNIYDIIKEEVQRQVELIYSTKFSDVNGQLTDGSIYYNFDQLTLFDIEADEGTEFYIGSSQENAQKVRIGSTCRYTLNPLEVQIGYIALAAPQFCVINYKCLTNQMTMTKQGG